MNIHRTAILYIISTLMLTGLAGCFKSEVAMDVKSSGAGTISVSAGMTQQAQTFASDMGKNPLDGLEENLSTRIGMALTGIEVKRWKEGEYDWVGVTKTFGSLEEINQLMGSSTLFNRFSLTRKRGILQDEFILDAELPALGGAVPPEYLLVDMSEYMQMNFSARLPGTILETNGAADANDPNRMVWKVPLDKPVSIKARSLAWNWLNVIGIAAAVLILAAAGISALAVFIIRKRKK
jgi:hypothetical protein